MLAEIRRGVERAQASAPEKARKLDAWLRDVRHAFAGRILPVDETGADVWGRMTARRSLKAVNSLLAATAQAHGMTLVTRNVADVAGLGATVLDPFRLEST